MLRTLSIFDLDNYHVSFPNDRPMAKAVVYGVYLIELSQTIIVARDCFASYATGFGDFGALISMQTIWLSAPISIGLGELHFRASSLLQ